MKIPFWSNDPTILFNKNYIFEIWPTANMKYEQKLNSITRLIIFMTILGYIITISTRIFFIGIITIFIIFILFKMQLSTKNTNKDDEGFQSGFLDKSKTIDNAETLSHVLKTEFQEGTKNNPFSNVLLTEIMDNPERKSAPPSFNPAVDQDIIKNIKKSVQTMNNGIKNTNKQLYGDLWANFELDQSNRAFYSTANTRVANDQGAFSKFLYGDMPSSKENNAAAAVQRVANSYRYTLY
jgi:hypothetical protein